MTVNLLELIQNQLSGSIMSNLGGLLGTSEAETSTAVAAATPSLLGGLMKQGSTDEGAGALGSTLDKFDGSLMDNVGAMFGLGAAGLAKLLMSQGKFLKGLLPAGMGDALGINGLLSETAAPAQVAPRPTPASTAASTAASTSGARARVQREPAPAASSSSSGGPLLSRLVPIALVAGLGIFAYGRWSAGGNVQASESSAASASTKLAGAFTDITDSLGSVKDAASAEAALPKLESAAASLDGIEQSANQLPAAARGPLRSVATKVLPALQENMTKVMNLAGVKDKLGPLLERILSKVKGLAG